MVRQIGLVMTEKKVGTYSLRLKVETEGVKDISERLAEASEHLEKAVSILKELDGHKVEVPAVAASVE